MISLVVVNYRSASLAVEAIASARAAAAGPLEVIVVDNSCDRAEADALRPHASTVIAAETNLGYAGAINRGRRHANGDVIVVSNADVVFAPGSIDALAAALERDVVVSGPALYWDEAHRWILPPADLHSLGRRAAAVAASRSASYARWLDRRRTRERIRFWSLARTTRVEAISGAVMAIRTSALDELGGFDERFRLYFEETDFLRRVAERRWHVVYVPAAKCRHIYNQSAGAAGTAASTAYAESESWYLRKWLGPLAASVIERLQRPARAPVWPPADKLEIVGDDVVVEASPLPDFATAAGYFPEAGPVRVPPEVRAAYRGDALFVRAVNRQSGKVVAGGFRYTS